MTVVDAHAHVIVPGLGAEVEWTDGTQVVQAPKQTANFLGARYIYRFQ